MSNEIEFKNSEELKNKLIKEYMDKFLQQHNLKPDQVVLVEAKDNDATYYYFAKKKEENE